MATMPNHRHRLTSCLFMALFTLLASATDLLAQQAGSSPVKIFILAGQSNMLGQGEISPVATPGTLKYTVANDPGGDYQFLVDGGGAWVVRDDVWIRDQDPSLGGLTVGYGSQPTTVGPELGFGHHIGDLYENQVLIVKAAWGGKSLAVDFRPPSSGGTTGFYYNEVLRLVNEATTNLSAYFPGYNGQGYEIAGFAWHQGWNDRVTPDFAAEYEVNMANFINDMRSDLGVGNLPFVIATTGMAGGTVYSEVELAQLAMANTPAFAGNVAVIDTRAAYEGLKFWQSAELSPANEDYHWNRNAKTYVNIGLAMGDAMSIMQPGRCPFRPRAVGGPGGVIVTWQNGTEIPTSVRILRNGSEIAAAAPASSATFLDTTAEPGVLDYELIFTMPGDPCDPLATTLHGGITDLDAAPDGNNFVLTWTNNMAYDAIEIRRNGALLEAALSGTATTYTDTSPPTSGVVTYTVAPTTGSSTPAEIELNLDLAGELGILNPAIANGGVNPATGARWAVGDQYRLAFVSSTGTPATSSDITTYNAFVQGIAATAGLGGATWKVIGSTASVDARDNTSTNTGTDGTGVAIFLVDGLTKVADNNTDLWDGDLDAPIGMNETGTGGLSGGVFCGTDTDGTKRGDGVPGDRVLGGSNESPPLVETGDMSKTSTRWVIVFHDYASSSRPVYALSDPLTIVDVSTLPPPTLNSFANDAGVGPILVGDTVTYTLSFSEAMDDGTIETEDFKNASDANVTIDSVSSTGDPAVFEVVVTTTGPGTLQLQVKAGAQLRNLADTALDTSSALTDTATISVSAPAAIAGELGILDLANANGGVNPVTGTAWRAGDTYRLAFVTSATHDAVSSDINVYNTWAQSVATTAGLGGTWKVIASSAAVAARDNTGTNPATTGVAIFLMDGTTKLADGNTDLWDGSVDAPLNIDENGASVTESNTVFTGTKADGTTCFDNVDRHLGSTSNGRCQTGRLDGTGNNWVYSYHAAVTDMNRFYALSEPLTIVAVVGKDFSEWIADYSVGAMNGFTDDPDGDRLANGLEAWFGTHPGEFNTGLANLTNNGVTTTFTHSQNANPPTDLSGYYEWSTNLTEWYDGNGIDGPPGGPTVNISPTTVGTTTTVTATASEALRSIFLRAGVRQN